MLFLQNFSTNVKQEPTQSQQHQKSFPTHQQQLAVGRQQSQQQQPMGRQQHPEPFGRPLQGMLKQEEITPQMGQFNLPFGQQQQQQQPQQQQLQKQGQYSGMTSHPGTSQPDEIDDSLVILVKIFFGGGVLSTHSITLLHK